MLQSGVISWGIATVVSMNCRIHRGCHEIGGNCVEIEASDHRIVLDLGLPLDDGAVELPDIKGIKSADDSLLGILISHPHPDHYGLLERLPDHVPVYMSAAAHRIIAVSSFFTPLPGTGNCRPKYYSDRQPIHLGPFRITPYLIDHSAFDSYCFLVEAGNRRLFYSGDIRAHGRKASLFEEIVTNPPEDIDVLICEGTQVGRDGGFDYPDEHSVANKMAEIFSSTKGISLVWCSSQNIDRISSVYEAAKLSNRRLIIDVYTAEVLRASGDGTLPNPAQDDVSVYLPFSQKSLIKRKKAFERVRPYYAHRIYPEALAEEATRSVMIFRPSMLRDLEKAQCLDGAVLISSLWSGYVKRDSGNIAKMESMGIARHHIHTSGHATVDELKRFVAAFPDSRIVPIHLEDRQGFQDLFQNVDVKDDGQWWEA